MAAFAAPPGARLLAAPTAARPLCAPRPPRRARRAPRAAAPPPDGADWAAAVQNPAVKVGDEGGDGGGGGAGVDTEKLREVFRSPALDEYAEQRAAGLTAPADAGIGSEFMDVWALSVAPRKAFELRNQYSRVEILLDRNFPDFTAVGAGAAEVVAAASLEELSMAKAKAVYYATGLPAIAETHELEIDAPESGSRVMKTLQQGYATRDVEGEGDAMIDRVRPISDETRRTSFISVVAYFDGEMELLSHGRTDVAIVFSKASYMTVAVSSALDGLYIDLTGRLGLKLVPPRGSSAAREVSDSEGKGPPLVGAKMLRERIMREGQMLDNGILKVSSFMNHMVDADLMEACGVELAERLRKLGPTKVLTVESTGLIPGMPTARQLNVPLVFARKSRPITISDSFQTTYRSATKGTSNELIVSCEYLDPSDRVVIIDDFLAGGSTAEALFKLANMARAKVIGVGVLVEKMSDGGRAFLSGYDVPVESLAKVLPSSDGGRIEVLEEEPWVSPDAANGALVEDVSMRIRVAREAAARRMARGANGDGEEYGDDGVEEGSAAAGRDAEASADLVDDDKDDLDIYDLDDDDSDYDTFDQLQDSMINRG